MTIPTHPDAFTTTWLESALNAPPGTLRGFKATRVGTGQMSLCFRIALDWKNGEGPSGIVAKCPSADPGTRAIAAALRSYALELGWYRDLSREIDVACPKCLHLESEGETDFVILLEDLAPAQQGDQLAGATLPQIEAAITQAAALHAPYWASPKLDQIEWLQPSPTAAAMIRQIVPSLYVQFRERYASRFAPDVMELCDALMARVDAYFDINPSALTVAHRDFRIDNILFSPQGRAYIVDWQTLAPGPGASDIAYLLGTSIADPAQRAREEERLVASYVDQLRALGADAHADDIWREYRLYAFSGVLMAIIASTNVERTERGDEMFAVMTERPARQAMHLNSLSLF